MIIDTCNQKQQLGYHRQNILTMFWRPGIGSNLGPLAIRFFFFVQHFFLAAPKTTGLLHLPKSCFFQAELILSQLSTRARLIFEVALVLTPTNFSSAGFQLSSTTFYLWREWIFEKRCDLCKQTLKPLDHGSSSHHLKRAQQKKLLIWKVLTKKVLYLNTGLDHLLQVKSLEFIALEREVR